MHKSKLGGFIIDCETDDLVAAAGFWGAALGLPVRELPGAEGDLCRKLDDTRTGLHIEAEVARLERLGAKKVRQIHSWWVMEAPTGQRFCVVRAASENFAAQASTWT